nr:glycosyltransferase [Natronomonas gomsonensis]
MALVAGGVSNTPTHLGVLGADLDVHAHAWYGWGPRFAFPRFDSISVLGSRHRQQLVDYGVPAESVFILTNAIETDVYDPKRGAAESEYDFVWSGRFSPEKAPGLFVDAVDELNRRGYNIRAAILGSGDLTESIEAKIHSAELSDIVDTPGWVDEPADYYTRSDTFVLTSEREALGLALIESMAMGLSCIAPRIGNIPDIADDGENALLVEERTPEAFADAMERVLIDASLHERLGANAIPVGQSFSYENAREDWREIVEYTTR